MEIGASLPLSIELHQLELGAVEVLRDTTRVRAFAYDRQMDNSPTEMTKSCGLDDNVRQ